MATFAKLDENNIVLEVLVVNDSDVINPSTQQEDEEYCITNTLIPQMGWSSWKQSSVNTRGGVHYDPNTNVPSDDQSKALRANYPGIGDLYDSSNNIFIRGSKSFPSWSLNTTTGFYEAPIANPHAQHQVDGEYIFPQWDDDNTRWLGKKDSKVDDNAEYVWNTGTDSWDSL